MLILIALELLYTKASLSNGYKFKLFHSKHWDYVSWA
jgi:hypothetical protein